MKFGVRKVYLRKKPKPTGKGGSQGGNPSNKPENQSNKTFRMSAIKFFLTYKGKNEETGQKIGKQDLKNFILKNPNENNSIINVQEYIISQQMYDSGQPHFHALISYSRRKEVTNQGHYDYLGIHPNIQTARNMKAILEYLYKEDPHPLTNMNVVVQRRKYKARESQTLFELLNQQMMKDPFTFKVWDYIHINKLEVQIMRANYTKALTLVKNSQIAAMRHILNNKPGIQLITPQLINQQLSQAEIKQYYSHPVYQKIIDHINLIHKYPNRDKLTKSPSQMPHLMLVGPSAIGKSALVDHQANQKHPHPGLMQYYATYHMQVGQKFFPPYRSYDFRIVRWNQFTIDSNLFPKRNYNLLLDYLEGAPSALLQKGKPATQREDHPRHILTSNYTLNQHIDMTFKSQQNRFTARMNLSKRIDCVVIPDNRSIHFLRKLFVSL